MPKWVAATPAAMAITTSTDSSSMSVKPSWRGRMALPARDVFVLACPARLVVGAQRVDVEGAVLARRAVDVGPAPGVGRQLLLGEIGPVPRFPLRRRFDQR